MSRQYHSTNAHDNKVSASATRLVDMVVVVDEVSGLCIGCKADSLRLRCCRGNSCRTTSCPSAACSHADTDSQRVHEADDWCGGSGAVLWEK
nr:hypothetical protein CFP56_30106 [Quercus suber]